MNDKTENPFVTLGLDPHLIRRLPDDRIGKVVSSIGRTLLAFYSVDQQGGGNEEWFKIINRALQELDQVGSPETYRAHKEAFLVRKSASKKMAELKQEIGEGSRMYFRLMQNFRDYLLGPHNIIKGTMFEAGPTMLTLLDTYERSFDSGAYVTATREKKTDKYFFVLQVERDGLLRWSAGGTTDGICPEPGEWYLLGCIPKDTLQREELSIWSVFGCKRKEMGTTNKRLSLTGARYNDRQTVNTRPNRLISTNSLAGLFCYMTPRLERDSYLLAVNRKASHVDKAVMLVGQIVKFNRTDSSSDPA